MATLNLATKQVKYTAADQVLLARAITLVSQIAAYDPAVKQDATTAFNALVHVSEHITAQRSGEEVK